MRDADSLVHIRAARERTIELLSAQYANDYIDVDELERRVEKAEHATTVAELDALTADLVPIEQAAPVTALANVPRSTTLVRAEDVPKSKRLLAFFGGTNRKGHWTVPRKLHVSTVFGGADIDFREAHLAPGVSRVKMFALFGGATVIVPPDLYVEVDGIGILGGFDDSTGRREPPGPDDPRLVISGTAIMGGIEIVERLPGESAREARRRKRRERKALAKQQRAELRGRDRNQLGPK
jgi:hypothetical protein